MILVAKVYRMKFSPDVSVKGFDNKHSKAYDDCRAEIFSKFIHYGIIGTGWASVPLKAGMDEHEIKALPEYYSGTNQTFNNLCSICQGDYIWVVFSRKYYIFRVSTNSVGAEWEDDDLAKEKDWFIERDIGHYLYGEWREVGVGRDIPVSIKNCMNVGQTLAVITDGIKVTEKFWNNRNDCKNGEKSRRYLELIEDAKRDYAEHPEKHGNIRFQLVWRDDCKEINLYTYWQGLNYAAKTPDIKVLLFAQDWGGELCECHAKEINTQLENGEEPRQYLDGTDISGKGFETDASLVELFASVGYPNIDKTRYEELFFTNFALGYRQGTKKSSSGMTEAVMDADADFAKRLIDILEPEIIICLGRHTYEAAVKAYGLKRPSGSFNKIIEKAAENPILITASSGKISKLYPVAHCGAMGTLNRNRGQVVEDGRRLALQLKDWKAVFQGK